MPNGVKYSTTTPSGSLRRGNVALGVTSNLGPTANTGFYSMPVPQSGKYIINKVSPSGIPNFFAPANDAELIRLARIEGATGADTGSAAAVLAWIAAQPNLEAVNFEYENIVTDGLIFNLDAGFVGSYPTTGTTWYDLSGNTNNGTLTNGPTFNSANSGSLVFDGTDDYMVMPFTTNYPSFTVSFFFKLTGTKNYSYAISTGNGTSTGSFQIEFNDPDAGNTARTLWIWWYSTSGFDGGLYVPSLGSTGNWNDNTWRMLTFTHTGTSNILYINGAISTYSTSGRQEIEQFGGSNYNLSIGRRQDINNLFFQGNIANMLVHNRALSATEVLQNYNALKGRFGL